MNFVINIGFGFFFFLFVTVLLLAICVYFFYIFFFLVFGLLSFNTFCVTLVCAMLFESLIMFTDLFIYSLTVKTNQFDGHETIVQIRKNEQIGEADNEKLATTRHNCFSPYTHVSGVWIDQLIFFFFFFCSSSTRWCL